MAGENFLRAKESLVSLAKNISDRVQTCHDLEPDICDELVREAFSIRVVDIEQQLRKMERAAGGEMMKAVFIGKADSGKSALINGILGQQILPNSSTICFVRMAGYEGDTPQMLTQGGKAIPVKDANWKGIQHALKSGGFGMNNIVDIRCPRKECPFFENEVVLVDTPGWDKEEDTDFFIRKQCRDCDVLVIVINANETKVLDESEEAFFKSIRNHLPRESAIFVVFGNKWGAISEEADANVFEICNQLKEVAQEFLSEDIKQMIGGFDKIFFVSAKDVSSPSFLDFQQALIERLSAAAAAGKMKKYFQKAENLMSDLQDAAKEVICKMEQAESKSQEILERYGEFLERAKFEAGEFARCSRNIAAEWCREKAGDIRNHVSRFRKFAVLTTKTDSVDGYAKLLQEHLEPMLFETKKLDEALQARLHTDYLRPLAKEGRELERKWHEHFRTEVIGTLEDTLHEGMKAEDLNVQLDCERDWDTFKAGFKPKLENPRFEWLASAVGATPLALTLLLAAWTEASMTVDLTAFTLFVGALAAGFIHATGKLWWICFGWKGGIKKQFSEFASSKLGDLEQKVEDEVRKHLDSRFESFAENVKHCLKVDEAEQMLQQIGKIKERLSRIEDRCAEERQTSSEFVAEFAKVQQ